MSAICGVIGRDGRPWADEDLDGVMGELAPLGTDGRGSWSGRCGRCEVALGAALRHRTPEDRVDVQPARGAGDRLVLVGDLRLDNRPDLAAALGLPDDEDVPDSRFVLAAYERWGEACVGRLIGAFAIAIADRDRGGVFVARDHLGLKPLVVHERPGVVAFASTALSLTALDGVGHGLDMRRALEVLALVYDSERTFVEGVRWVPPGGALWVDAGGVRRRIWWRPDPHAVEERPAEVHERELREALELAVEARLRSVGPAAAMVSGGLDSTSVAATAALLVAPGRLRTYTSVPPPGWTGLTRPLFDADESPLVRDLAAMHPNMEPSFVHLETSGGLFDGHEALWELGAGPTRNPANMMWERAIVERARAEGARVLLNGDRGNYCFSADGPDWLVALTRARRPVRALRELETWTRRVPDGRWRNFRRHLAGPLAPSALRRARRAVVGVADPVEVWLASTPLRPEAAAELDLPALLPKLDPGRRRDPRADVLAAARTISAQAETGMALEASTGVDRRDPTSDRRVIEAAMRQPEWVRRRGGVTRAVARGAMSDRLPTTIAARVRRGEQLPDWFDQMTIARGEIADELAALADHGPSRELVDVRRLEALLANWPDRSACAVPEVIRDYRLALMRGLLVSRYLRWFESRAASERARTTGAAA